MTFVLWLIIGACYSVLVTLFVLALCKAGADNE